MWNSSLSRATNAPTSTTETQSRKWPTLLPPLLWPNSSRLQARSRRVVPLYPLVRALLSYLFTALLAVHCSRHKHDGYARYAHPSPSGNILPRLLSTSITGMSLVPALVRSFSSLSFSRSALNPRTLSACRLAVSMRCSTLCTLSDRRSTLNSRTACRAASRVCAWAFSVSDENALSVSAVRIFASSASRSETSGTGSDCCCCVPSEFASAEADGKRGGSSGGG
jgi:hypothetical protein